MASSKDSTAKKLEALEELYRAREEKLSESLIEKTKLLDQEIEKNCSLTEENAKLKKKLVKFEEKFTQKIAMIQEQLEESRKHTEIEDNSELIRQLQSEIESQNQEIENKNRELQSKDKELESKNTELDKLEKELEEKSAEIERKNKEMAMTEVKIQQLSIVLERFVSKLSVQTEACILRIDGITD